MLKSIRLSNGVNIPVIGLGVYQARGDECSNAVKVALKAGYRHLDSALAYKNESLVGQAVLASGIPREEIFFTTKLPPGRRGYEDTVKAIDESLRNCGLGYIDLYLIHAPYGDRTSRLGQWKAIEEGVAAKKIVSAGVSNYGIHHIKELLDSKPQVKPVINQIELHPWLCRTELVEYCRQNDIALEAYSPLTRGQFLNDATLLEIAKKNKRSPAQILIKWSLQKGYITLPKSTTESRILENFDVSFTINEADMSTLDGLDADKVTGWDPTIAPL